ncbi:hypothetical protein EVAR_100403_1 [Eumeta japonica]|uniref:Uncharacterized protein n=1 Tax=Eumeta variegata TaxID=151549 RepID=A0A4C1ZUH2_EUMVA|nr:hypothetical protein EVAR_100403_1 [Eumeta japonica]
MITIWNIGQTSTVLPVCGAALVSRPAAKAHSARQLRNRAESEFSLPPPSTHALRQRSVPNVSRKWRPLAIKYERIYYYITAFTFYVSSRRVRSRAAIAGRCKQCSINKKKRKNSQVRFVLEEFIYFFGTRKVSDSVGSAELRRLGVDFGDND